jgi:uncharacterized protein YabE (DUF348 family)
MNIHTHVLSFLHKHAFAIGVFGILFSFTFLAGSFVVANGQTVGPDDSHIVSLSVDGQETAIPTRAQTVGELLDKTDVLVTEYDLVEPAKDTPIVGDNFSINVYKARPVSIVDEGKVTRTFTPHQGAKLISEKAGVTVYPEDKLTIESGNSFVDEQIIGEKITIDRATPVTVNLYGAGPVTYRTHAATVGDLLTERGITPEEGATLSPSADTALSANTAVFISKFGKQVVTEDVAIPFTVQSTPDPSMPAGKVTVTVPGKSGLKKVTYEIETRDGKEVGRVVLQEVEVTPAVAQQQTKGSKPVGTVSGDKMEWMRAAGISEADFMAVDFVIGHESGWRPGALNGSGCAGLGQACPGSKLANVCPNWQVDPVCQLKFFSGYAGRYGGWQGAYQAWLVKGWW